MVIRDILEEAGLPAVGQSSTERLNRVEIQAVTTPRDRRGWYQTISQIFSRLR